MNYLLLPLTKPRSRGPLLEWSIEHPSEEFKVVGNPKVQRVFQVALQSRLGKRAANLDTCYIHLAFEGREFAGADLEIEEGSAIDVLFDARIKPLLGAEVGPKEIDELGNSLALESAVVLIVSTSLPESSWAGIYVPLHARQQERRGIRSQPVVLE